MSEREPKTGEIKAQVFEGLDEAREFAGKLDFDEVKSGQWFVELLQKVVQAYDRNATAEYLRQKYPGLSPDEIADILISVTARYATVAGGVAGAAATSTQLATLSSFGMTAPLFFGVIGAEMLYLARIQMRLVLDLSVVYDLQLDPEDPEDVLMVFGYAVGVAPTELLGTVASKAAGGGAKTLVKKYVSKSVLKTIQSFARKLGFTILQRTIIKYTVPVASAIVGSTYNYATTVRWAGSRRLTSGTGASLPESYKPWSRARTPTIWCSPPRPCTWLTSTASFRRRSGISTGPCSRG